MDAGALSNEPCDALAYVNPTSWGGTATLFLLLCTQRAQEGFGQLKQTTVRSQKLQVKISILQSLAVHTSLDAAVEGGSCRQLRHCSPPRSLAGGNDMVPLLPCHFTSPEDVVCCHISDFLSY